MALYTMNLLCTADINECMEGRDNCDVNAVCSDSVGSLTCDCVDGFIGNGTTCTGMYVIARNTVNISL